MSKLLIINGVQASGDIVEVLPHIILYLSTRQSQDIGSPVNARTGFFWSKLTQYVDILTKQSLQIMDGRHEV